MSLSGSSASRNSIWAITRFASSSSMKVGRKMIRSLRRREKMSNARSPRGVCSMTIGTSATGPPTLRLRVDLGVLDQQRQDLGFPQAQPEVVEVAAALEHAAHRLGGAARLLRDPRDLRLDVGVGHGQLLPLGHRLLQ